MDENKTPVQRIIQFYESRDIDNVKLANTLIKPYINNSLLLNFLNDFYSNNRNHKLFILDVLEYSWWEKIHSIKYTEELWLSACDLTKIPKQIFKLKNLNILKLSFNEITEIPKDISLLINLVELYISDNELTTLPNSIKNLKHLNVLNLDGNPLSLKKQMKMKIKKLLPNTHINCDNGFNRE